MFKDSKAFSSFSVDDIQQAKKFYETTLGVDVLEIAEGLQLRLAGGAEVFIYPKGDHHQPARFTILNFVVSDINEVVEDLTQKGVQFEQYDFMKTDEKGISKQGDRSMAWFKDPAGNILSVIQDSR